MFYTLHEVYTFQAKNIVISASASNAAIKSSTASIMYGPQIVMYTVAKKEWEQEKIMVGLMMLALELLQLARSTSQDKTTMNRKDTSVMEKEKDTKKE